MPNDTFNSEPHEQINGYVYSRVIMTTNEHQMLMYVEEKFADSYCDSLHPLAMTQQLSDFIRTHCRCHYCHERVHKSLARCSCSPQKSGRIIVEFPTNIFETTLLPILEHQEKIHSYKRKSRSRKLKLSGAGQHTDQEIDLLLLIQEKRCYYCATHLQKDNGATEYHIDHYVSLANGGRNEIANLVLTCPACNLRKGIEDGNSFIYRASRNLTSVSREKAKAIRRKVKAHKKKLITNK